MADLAHGYDKDGPRPVHVHRCRRCGEEFSCYTPDVCIAQYDVLPRIVVRDASRPGGVRIFDHCAPPTKPEPPTPPRQSSRDFA